ncbi:hypothetical protein D0Y65_043045, partial [Glycine soja]
NCLQPGTLWCPKTIPNSNSNDLSFQNNRREKTFKETTVDSISYLRQYLKEKGSFGDLTLGIALACTNGPPDTSCHSATTMQSVYPRHLEIPTFINPRSMEKEAKAAQLTIFYDGQVVVFDDFPADKVQETKMATAAGAVALLYYTLNRKLQTHDVIDEDGEENGSDSPADTPLGIGCVSHRLIQAPATWLETISTLSETLRFTYSETLGKWPIRDLAFGINFLLKRQGNYHVGSEFCGKDSVQLKGSEITAELKYLLNLLTLCWHFSKKPFPLFLEETGYTEENVLLREAKAGVSLV